MFPSIECFFCHYCSGTSTAHDGLELYEDLDDGGFDFTCLRMDRCDHLRDAFLTFVDPRLPITPNSAVFEVG